MTRYRIVLLEANGAVAAERVLDCANDDEAIDRIGQLGHRGAMDVYAGERTVARFPPVSGARPLG